MKTKQAKSFRNFHSAHQVKFFEEIFDETHEKVIAFNVILALFRIRVIRFEGNQIVHDAALADEISMKLFAPSNEKEQILNTQINMETFCFNYVEICKLWEKSITPDFMTRFFTQVLAGELQIEQ